MTDVLFLIGTVAAFGVFVLLLRGCEKIVGPDQLAVDAVPIDTVPIDTGPVAGPDPDGAELSGATS